MKNKEDLQKVVQYNAKRPVLNSEETLGNSRVGNHLKKFIYIASLTGMGFFLNSCVAGHVRNEPVYVEYARPVRPSNQHIWIDGDWGWNNHSRMYVQRTGYWERQRPGQVFVTGHWETTPRGRSWSNGYWQRQGHQERPQRQMRQERPLRQMRQERSRR